MKKLFTIFGTVLFSLAFVPVCFLTTIYAQTWIQVNIDGFGDANNKVAIGFGEYGNFFYMGVANNITGCEVWRTAAVGGPPFTDWTQVNTDGFGDANNSWPGHAVYDNLLYVSPENGVTGVEIWQYNGTTWTQVNTDGFGDANNGNAHLLAHNNFLYAATGNEVTGCEVWRTAAVGGPPFTDWTQVNTDGFGEVINEDAHLSVYDNFLYVAVDNGCDPITGGTQIWRYDGGTTWTKVNTNGFGDTNNEQAHLIVYDNLLYAVVNNDLGLQVWQYNGATWRQVNTDGFGDVNNNESGGQAVHDGYLYVTTDNDITGCEVWRTAAVGGPPFTDWTQVNTDGFGDVNNSDAKLSVYNSSLYAGSLNEVTGAEVWKYLAKPTADIKANGSDGPIAITTSDTLSVTIELDPGDYPGVQADWWVVAGTPFGWYYYNVSGGSWIPGFSVTYQGPLFTLAPPLEVLSMYGLPIGGYTFYFGVDGSRNGNLDEPLYYDSVEVSITP